MILDYTNKTNEEIVEECEEVIRKSKGKFISFDKVLEEFGLTEKDLK